MHLNKRCFIPIGSKPFIQSKIEQSKHKQKYQDLTIQVLLLFVFRFFTPSFFFLKDSHNLFSHCSQSKEKAKRKRKQRAKNTRKQRIYKENSNPRPLQPKFNLSLLLPFCEANSNSEANAKPEKGAENKAEIIKSENLKMKKIPKISWKGKGYFRWDKRSVFNGT